MSCNRRGCCGRYPCGSCSAAIQREINEDSSSSSSNVGLAGNIALGVAAIGGNIAASGLLPTTNDLSDAQKIGQSSYESAPDEASRGQGTNTSQNK
jgi:hypothetical protein